MTVELICVGTELLLGSIVNTNAAYLAGKCAGLGLSLYHQSVVGDNMERLKIQIKQALERSDIIILSGGLGPTEDDLTKEAVASALDRKLVPNETARKNIVDYFEKRKLTNMTDNNWKQELIIDGGKAIYNHNGTAVGILLEIEDKCIILLPGPPSELIPMFEQEMEPYLKNKSTSCIVSKMIKIVGIGESKVETMIKDLIESQKNPTIATYAKAGQVDLRVTASADTEEKAKDLLKPIIREIKKRFHDKVFSMKEEDTLESVIINELTKRKLTITTAESCTAGLLASTLVNAPGASEVFLQGFITYSNKAKRKYLGVNKNTLKQHGAVSKKTAKEMAKGAAIETDSDVALAITGIAGPDGGTEEKPVGLVYIACYFNGDTTVREFNFAGDRSKIRQQSVMYALDLLHDLLK